MPAFTVGHFEVLLFAEILRQQGLVEAFGQDGGDLLSELTGQWLFEVHRSDEALQRVGLRV